MPSVDEAVGAKSQLAAGLAEGVRTLSQDQTVTFVKYVKVILPLDGFVFWIKASLVSPSALFNATKYNAVALNQPPGVSGEISFEAQGSLHYAINTQQREDETLSINSFIFTALHEVQDLNEVGPFVMYIGEIYGQRFAFNRRGSFYKQADLYHYTGDAIYPALASQIVDDPRLFDSRHLVVSNSLPVWLSLNAIMPVYPSFLVEDNLAPPYASIHIEPGSTEAIQGFPSTDVRSNHYQLTKDRVKITMYGLRNDQALDYQDYVNQFSLDTDIIGVMNTPIVRDEKRPQPEFSVIAMKKTIEYEVSYYQVRIRDLARQLILSAIVTFNPS